MQETPPTATRPDALTRGALAMMIFMLALLIRLWLLPPEDELAFLTFYPAVIAVFYFCGFPLGLVITGLSALVGSYIFLYPQFTAEIEHTGWISITFFVLTSVANGLLVRYTHALIVKRNEAHAALLTQKAVFEDILNDQTEVICRFHPDGSIVYVNDAFCRYFGQTPGYWVGRSWQPVVHPDDLQRVLAQVASLSPDTPVVSLENRVLKADGSTSWCHFVNRAKCDAQGDITFIQAVGRDISERKALEQRLELVSKDQQLMLDNDLVGILRLKNRVVIWHNKALGHLFGYGRELELVGQSSAVLYPDEEAFLALGAAAYPCLKQGGQYRTQIQMRRQDGTLIWIDLSGGNLDPDSGESLWFFADITAGKVHQLAVEHAALHDALTGLANRLLLEDRLDTALAAAQRSGSIVAVCYLDLDGFKPVNDTFGHEAGDFVLQEVSRRLCQAVRAVDTVARIGGDEFVVLLTGLANQACSELILQRISEGIEQTITLPSGHQLQVTSSMGLAYYPHDATHSDALLRMADQAMYQHKRLGHERQHAFHYRAT